MTSFLVKMGLRALLATAYHRREGLIAKNVPRRITYFFHSSFFSKWRRSKKIAGVIEKKEVGEMVHVMNSFHGILSISIMPLVRSIDGFHAEGAMETAEFTRCPFGKNRTLID